MLFAQRFFASLAAFFVFCLPLCAGAAAGRTAGTANVTPTGSASYSIPIVVPPGVNGMTPSIGLSYDSRKDNGVVGVGWSIAGLSAIVRCPRTRAQDGQPREVRLDSSDRFCLDGNKLRALTGTYGGDGATYRTEIVNFSRITSSGVAGNGPARFTVEGKDGLTYYYGYTGDSRIEALGQTTPRAWALDQIRDRAHNYISFTYVEDTTNGSFRISSIGYGGNALHGTSPTHSVSFVYETRPSNEIDTRYIAGSLVKEITRLDRVDVLYGSTVLQRYELTYESALSSTSKSRLASIQECAGAPLDCLPATTFSYQNGTSELGGQVSTSVALNVQPWAIDYDGDGRRDLVYSSSGTSGSGVWMVMRANASGGYNAPVSTGITNTNYLGAIPIDYNSDGADDLLVPYSGGTWWVMLGGYNSGLGTPINTGAPVTATGHGNNARAMDVNGDGLEDLVWADVTLDPATQWNGGNAIRYRLREWGGTFSSTVYTVVGPTPANTRLITPAFFFAHRTDGNRKQDFNGDGAADILYRYQTRTWTGGSWIESPVNVTVHCVGAWNIVAAGMETAALSEGLYYGDFNGDGKTDLFFPTVDPFTYSVRLSTGATLAGGFNVSMLFPTTIVGVLDWDGDGYDDVLARRNSVQSLHVLRSTGESLTNGFSPVSTENWGAYTNFRVMDLNGDALPDLGYQTAGGIWNYRLHAGVTPDLLQTATDGFGNYTTFNYSSLLNTYYSTTTPRDAYPSRPYRGSMIVVTSATASNGIGGSYTMSYLYGLGQINLQGRGFEGFGRRTSQDSRTSIYTEERFNQTFPYTGTLASLEIIQPDGTTVITGVSNTWSNHAYGSGTETAYLPYISASTIQRNSVGNFAYNGDLVSYTSTTNSVDAATGTLYDTTMTVTEASTANGVQPAAVYTRRIHRPTAYFANPAGSWCIGRPGRTEYTSSHSQYGGGAITRVIDQTWDTASCRVTQQVVEPGSAQWRVTTDIGYDSFGNVNSETVTGVGMTPRTTTFNFDATGRFPQSGKNALSQTTQFGWNASTGTLASITDPNGIAVSWQYDAFGRITRESRADNTFTTWQYNDCAPTMCLTSNTKMVVFEYLYDTSGNFINHLLLYTDRFDRPLAARSLTMSGSFNRIDREYDALGRVHRQSAPCMGAYDCAEHWTAFTYDLLGRATQVQRPISDSNPTLQSSSMYYEGLTTRTVDALGKQSTRVSNAVGLLARSIDHDGYYQSFDYDGFGNSVRVTDSASNVLMSNVFNVRGMRTSQTDMDTGTWTYTPNALGEVVSQTDANNQTATFGYDLLGRLTSRTEPEGVSTFTFGTSAAARNIGQLASMSGPGYAESFTYDSIGRLSRRTIASDATYQIDYSYNHLGALDTLTYPTSTSGYRLKLQYGYASSGILQRVSDFNAPSTVFWAANDTDARGAVISETLGNGLQTVRGYDAVTGRLDYIQSGPGGGGSRQDDSYQWDQVGNLTQRSEANLSKVQNFTYDNLHRLTSWSLVGGTTNNLTYDALGNITSKTGLGTYTYHATRKHQVTAVNGVSYAYDNNGNVTARGGQPISWYSYNLPRLISGPSSYSSEFFYGPDRSRWKQVASYGGTAETTIYIGGLIEKVTLGSVTSWKHYVSGANGTVAEIIRRSNGTNETVYLLKDHLGSTEVVTTAGGGQLSRLAYNPLGARVNGGSWTGTPASSAWTTITNTTRHGFTSHEMLDNLDLIHMNGRVYDQTIGRFLSADPLVQAPGFTQSFNRYSYVFNNPLKYTDPSGFACLDPRKPGSGAGPGYCAPPNYDPPPPVIPTPPAPPAFTPGTTDGHVWDTISTVASQITEGFKDYLGNVRASWGEWPGDGSLESQLAALPPVFGTPVVAARNTVVGAVESGSQLVKLGAVSKVTGTRAPLVKEIALGLSHNLERFAAQVGAAAWWDWQMVGLTRARLDTGDLDGTRFARVFKAVVERASVIHFDLSGLQLEGLAGRAARFIPDHWTEAELLIVVRNPALLSKGRFYRGGRQLEDHEVQELLRRLGQL